MAMIAITTSNSINVNARSDLICPRVLRCPNRSPLRRFTQSCQQYFSTFLTLICSPLGKLPIEFSQKPEHALKVSRLASDDAPPGNGHGQLQPAILAVGFYG